MYRYFNDDIMIMKCRKLCLWLHLFLGYLMISTIYCDVYCEVPPAIPHGEVTGIKSGDYYLPYDEVEIKCEPGYKYNGPAEFIMCEEDGNWEEDFGACIEIFCDPPESIINGVIPELVNSNFTSFPHNFEVTYECIQGYRLLGGDSWRICRKNGWSGKTPQCKEIRCPDPGVLEHGDREGNNFQIGSKVRFKCFTGYNLLGSFERFCKPNGQWTGELPRCDNPVNYCPNPGIPINGFKNGASYDIGDTVTYRCQPGFLLLGSDVRECLPNKTWSGTEAKCMAPYDFDNNAQMSEMLKFQVAQKFNVEKEERRPPHEIETLTFETRSVLGVFPEVIKFLLIPSSVHEQSDSDYLSLGRTIHVSNQRRLILHFAFDVSGSVGSHYLQKSIEFAKAIVRKVGISRDGNRASAVVFSSTAQNVFLPMNIETEEEVLRYLDNISFTGGGTSASSALAQIKENIDLEEEEQYFGRKNKEDVVFIITDGKINMGGNPEMDAKALKERNIAIYCIGITGDPRIETLYKIASSSNYGNEERQNVFILKNYASFAHLIQEITDETPDFSECGLGLENMVDENQGTVENEERRNEPWPWMAAVYFLLSKFDGDYKLRCGGTIIKENFILTAAHCMYFKDTTTRTLQLRQKEDIIVKIGLFNVKDETKVQEYGVKRIFIHENYHPGNFSVQRYDYDIALLELDRPIEFNRRIRPICLPPEELPENSLLYSSKEFGWTGGWGHDGVLSPHMQNTQLMTSPKLKQLRLPIQSDERCIKSLEEKKVDTKYFTDRMFCAGSGKSGHDTCFGDSGGPLMQAQMNSKGFLYWTQVGIVSWGIGCGLENLYGYYTKVQIFRSWIDDKIGVN